MTQTKKWVGLKDVILVTLLSALWIVVSAVVMVPFTSNLSLAMGVGPACALIVSGTIYMLMCAKAPYRGTLMLFCVIEAIYNLVLAGIPLVAGINVVTGIVLELVMLNGGYRSKVRMAVAYAVFGVLWIMAPAISVLSTRAATEAALLAGGFTQEYIDAAFAMYSTSNLIVSSLILIVGAVIGSLLGYRLLKKHFEPAGIVQDDE